MSKARIRGNIYVHYNEGFKAMAAEMIKSVGKCQRCGLDKNNFKSVLTVAHLDQNPKNDSPKNLQVLCQKCHIALDLPFHVFSRQTMIKKTDNSFLEEKVRLRLDSLETIKKQTINVLEAFAGDGNIWREVQRQTDKQINILKIEMKDHKKGVYLLGDNMKFIPLFDFSVYDVIDFDAYGSPYNQLKVCFLKNFTGVVHCTFIQTAQGRLHKGMICELGYTSKMYETSPTLFARNPMQKMKDYLSIHGVKKIHGYFSERKNYFWFSLAQSVENE